jgi:membrane associated rhomboid family serine protease
VIPLADDRRRRTFPFVTYALIAVNLVVFAREVSAPNPEAFINAFAAIPFNLTHGVQLPFPSPHPTALTLLSSQFLHGGFLHVGFNMLFLWIFGPQIEEACGHFGFLAFYLICGAIGGATQTLVDPSSHVPQIGASGAIAGVLGAYIVSYPTNSIATLVPLGFIPIFMRIPAVLVIGVWAAVQFVHGFGSVAPNAGSEAGGGTAYFAHIGGFLAGVLGIALFRRRRVPPRRYRYYP